ACNPSTCRRQPARGSLVRPRTAPRRLNVAASERAAHGVHHVSASILDDQRERIAAASRLALIRRRGLERVAPAPVPFPNATESNGVDRRSRCTARLESRIVGKGHAVDGGRVEVPRRAAMVAAEVTVVLTGEAGGAVGVVIRPTAARVVVPVLEATVLVVADLRHAEREMTMRAALVDE